MITRRGLLLGVLAILVVGGVVLAAGFVVSVGDHQSADTRPETFDRGDGVGLTASNDAGGGAGGYTTATPSGEPRDREANAEADDALPTVQGRARIRTGRITLRVDDVGDTRRALAAQVREQGGYVSDVSQRQHRDGNRTWSSAELTLRVPAENFSRLRSETKGSGIVLREDISTRDVTDQLVDLNARIENLDRQRDRLRTMYERANETEELLAIQRQLSDVQGEIERLEARRKSLRDQVTYATLTVDLREPEPGSPRIDPAPYHERSVLGAIVASIDGVIVLARAAVVTVGYALPYLLVAGLLALPVWVWRRRRLGRDGFGR